MRQTYVESSQDHSLRQKRLVQEGLDGPIQGKKPHLPFLTQSLTLILQEGRTGQVTITNFKPAEVDCLLKFIYTGTIDLRKSYPQETSLPALMKIWKMADFFCLDLLRNLVIKAANGCSREMALVFCAFDPPPRSDQKKARLFGKDFVPAVKALYEDEIENLKHEFAPIILGLAVASIHSFSQMQEFEKLLQDVPQFCAEWATALMKGMRVPDWQGWGTGGKCMNCRGPADGNGVVDTFTFMRCSTLIVVCAECYGGPNLENWKNHGGW